MARAMAIQPVPEIPKPGSLQVQDEVCPDPQTPMLTIRQRHGRQGTRVGRQSLAEYHDVFSIDPVELGCTHTTEQSIKVTEDTPFKEQFRQIPPPMVVEVRNHLREMLESGAIRPSQSAWCNVIVLVRKKDGGLYFCIDFQCLNAHTKKDSYPLPQIQEALESLVGTGHFSCLDLKSGFWKMKMDKASKKCTAFTVGNLGFFKCDRMPFGLCNALATFQWLMQNCIGELNFICLIYLDDLIMFSQTAEEHLHQLRVVFDCLREYNLKLKPLKCSLFKEEINYLAHKMSKKGV